MSVCPVGRVVQRLDVDPRLQMEKYKGMLSSLQKCAESDLCVQSVLAEAAVDLLADRREKLNRSEKLANDRNASGVENGNHVLWIGEVETTDGCVVTWTQKGHPGSGEIVRRM